MARPMNLDNPVNGFISSSSNRFGALRSGVLFFLRLASLPFKTVFESCPDVVAASPRSVLNSRAFPLRANENPVEASQIVAAFVSALFAVNACALEFETKNIRIGEKVITVEIADTNSKRALGLMNRQRLEKDHGMLFVFPDENFRRFWMKETYIPLDIAYFSREKALLEVHKAVPVKSAMQRNIPQYSSRNRAMYVLEMNQGWFERNEIQIGEKFSFETE